MRLWIDTDIGTDVDDALALAYALRHPDLELVGVSTVFGDVALRSRIAQALLAAANATEIPVITGLGVPRTPGRAGLMFGHEGRGLLEDPEPRRQVKEESGSAERIDALAQALARAEPDVVLAIGPLTNLGALAEAGHALPPLAIMGGKLEDVLLPGMLPHISEWNWFCDPLAVQRVLAAKHDVRPRVMPAEITFRTRLADGDVTRLGDGDALARALARLCEHWLAAQREILSAKRPVVALHDPLTAAVLVRPDLCPFEARRIRVDDEGAAQLEPGPANVDAAVDVDPAAVRKHLMSVWLGLGLDGS